MSRPVIYNSQVPPIILRMLESCSLLRKYDLSSISAVFTAAAPLGKETALALNQAFPSWKIRQAYALSPFTLSPPNPP